MSRPNTSINGVLHLKCGGTHCERRGEWLAEDEFYASPRRTYGRASDCKRCHGARAQAHYFKHHPFAVHTGPRQNTGRQERTWTCSQCGKLRCAYAVCKDCRGKAEIEVKPPPPSKWFDAIGLPRNVREYADLLAVTSYEYDTD